MKSLNWVTDNLPQISRGLNSHQAGAVTIACKSGQVGHLAPQDWARLPPSAASVPGGKTPSVTTAWWHQDVDAAGFVTYPCLWTQSGGKSTILSWQYSEASNPVSGKHVILLYISFLVLEWECSLNAGLVTMKWHLVEVQYVDIHV